LNASEPASSSETAKDASSKGGQKKEEISMFSDYEED
jgi:hypothetical protein